MKNLLFQVFTRGTVFLIAVSDRVFGLPAALFLWLAAASRITIAKIGYVFMRTIDANRCEMIEAEANADPFELERQTMELKLLESSYKVRDHAQETGDWTDHHTQAIEAIGTALHAEIGWDEEAVMQHMQDVVHSIPGLELESWFEDED